MCISRIYHKSFYDIVEKDWRFERISDTHATGITWSPRLGKLIYCDAAGHGRQWTPAEGETVYGDIGALRSLVVDPYRMLMGINDAEQSVVRYTQEGECKCLIRDFHGVPLHPQCLAIHSGSYFYMGCENGIYHSNPESLAICKASGEMKIQPVALCMSADETTILFIDKLTGDICLSEFEHDGTLGGRFCRFTWASDFPDGCPTDLQADVLGNIYCAAPDGLHIYSKGGTRLAVLKPAFRPELLAVSGENLFVSSDSGVYRLKIGTTQKEERPC